MSPMPLLPPQQPPPPRPRTLSNASSTATLEAAGSNSSPQPPQWPQCHSPIFNYIEKLRLDDLNDDLEDINNLIDTEVGVENLPQDEYDNSHLMAQFQHREMTNKIKVLQLERYNSITLSAVQQLHSVRY